MHSDIHVRLDPRVERKIGNLLDALEALVRRLAETKSEITPEMIAAAAETAQQTQDKLKASLEKGPPPT